MSTTLANPAPLGLMGFGMTTILLNIHNLGVYPINSMLLAMGIFYGGMSQVIVGIMCFKRGDTFGTTAFTSYGLFWLSLVALIIMPYTGLPASSPGSMGFYLLLWGVFTAFMFFASLRYAKAKQIVFGSLTLLFFLLAIHDFTGIKALGPIAGILGIFCGSSAIYFAMAQVINHEYKRTILPIGDKKSRLSAVSPLINTTNTSANVA